MFFRSDLSAGVKQETTKRVRCDAHWWLTSLRLKRRYSGSRLSQRRSGTRMESGPPHILQPHSALAGTNNCVLWSLAPFCSTPYICQTWGTRQQNQKLPPASGPEEIEQRRRRRAGPAGRVFFDCCTSKIILLGSSRRSGTLPTSNHLALTIVGSKRSSKPVDVEVAVPATPDQPVSPYVTPGKRRRVI